MSLTPGSAFACSFPSAVTGESQSATKGFTTHASVQGGDSASRNQAAAAASLFPRKEGRGHVSAFSRPTNFHADVTDEGYFGEGGGLRAR